MAPIQPNLWDRVVGYFNPKKGCERLRYRAALGQGYDATRKDRLSRRRVNQGGTGDDHLDHDSLFDMRETSRDLFRNNGLFKSLVLTASRNVIGKAGYKVKADQRVRDYWRDWIKKQQCDARGKQSFWQMVRTALRAQFVDGDHLLYLDSTDGGRLTPIEGDRLVTPAGQPAEVVNGIRVNRFGMPLNYWVANITPNRHATEAIPFGYAREDQGQWYGANEIIHVCDFERASHSRGVPVGSTIKREIDDLDSMLAATRIAARLAAMLSFVVTKNEDAEGYAEAMANRNTDIQDSSDSEPRIEDIQNGEVNYLNAGESMYSVGSAHPGEHFGEFVRLLARLVGLPFGMPIELVLMDFSQTNFSASRLAIEQAKKAFEEIQTNLIADVIDPIFEWVIRLAIRRGKFGSGSEETLLKHTWIPTGWPYIEPVKDATADDLMLQLRITSRQRISARRGDDWFEIQDELDQEAAELVKRGQTGLLQAEPPNFDDDDDDDEGDDE